MKTKLLDCTLRDGGYYTNWDFNPELVDSYIQAMNALPIDYIEIGYRNNPSKEYLGKFGYTPVSVLKHIRKNSKKKIVVMLNEKSTRPTDLEALLTPIVGYVDMVRIAIDPKNFDRAIVLAKAVKAIGFEVGFNTMYMSKWHEYDGFLDKLSQLNGFVDLFCMVDSFGGITPDEVRSIYMKVKQRTTCPIGFHGHNNLQLGLINTLTAIECGVDYVDATILGMGRGAGNLNMELLLAFLNKQYALDVDFNILGDVITAFMPLMKKYQWGTNLPYMLSGANSFPQKEVMDWVTNRTYSFNSIVRALDNRREHVGDNAKYPVLNVPMCDKVLLIGGGNSVVEHEEAIKLFLQHNPDVAVVFVTARHAGLLNDIDNKKYYVLVGNEAKRMLKTVSDREYKGTCILAPYPRTMGTEVPYFAESTTFELNEIRYASAFKDSCTAVGLQLALDMNASKILMVGYDGYKGQVLSDKEMSLTIENRTLFEDFKKKTGKDIISLLPTQYNSLDIKSIYQYL